MARRLGILSVSFFLILLAAATPSFGAGENVLFLPFIQAPARAEISHLEVTQGTQDSQNGVPLVANRPAVLRVYAETINQQPVANVNLSVSAERGGVELGTRTLGPKTIPATPVRGDLDSTFNLLLPADWLFGDVRLTVTLTNSSQTTLDLSFVEVPDLNLRIVPIRYTHLPNGQTYLTPNIDTVSDWMMRTYPVGRINVSFRSPYNFVGNLESGSSWNQLLPSMRTLLLNERTSLDQVFYGLIPGDWFSQGIAGYGYVGLRASIGLNLYDAGWGANTAGELAAHEIGHNFGRRHVDCAPGGSISGIDENYPYDPETIGQFGLDGLGAGSLRLIAPDAAKDFMSYCEPAWVSDYTYQALMGDQMAFSVAEAATAVPHYVISGQFQPDGSLTLDPVYILNTTAPAPTFSNYAVTLLNAAGEPIGRHPAGVLIAGEPGVSGRWLAAFIPVGTEPPASLQVVEAGSGTILVVRELQAPILSTIYGAADLQNETNGMVQLHTEQPALVRVSTDNGRSWQIVAQDVAGGTVNLDLASLPGGGQPLVEIIPGDINQPHRQQLTMPVQLPDRPPQAWLSGPTEMKLGAPELLFGYAADMEDGSLPELAWTVNGAAVRASGWLSLQELPVGTHQIVVTARDAAGQTAVVSHNLVVLP